MVDQSVQVSDVGDEIWGWVLGLIDDVFVMELQELEPADTAKDIQIDETLEKSIEADLAELEQISKTATGKALTEDDLPAVVEEAVEATLEDGVKKVCDRLADGGIRVERES